MTSYVGVLCYFRYLRHILNVLPHTLRLKNTIKHIIQNRKDAYITFLDVTKAYDKAWLDVILYVMHKEGTYLPVWKLVKELNQSINQSINQLTAT